MAKKPVKKGTKSAVKAKAPAKSSVKSNPKTSVKTTPKTTPKTAPKIAAKTSVKTSVKTIGKASVKIAGKAPVKAASTAKASVNTPAKLGAKIPAQSAVKNTAKVSPKKAGVEEKIQKSKKLVVPSLMGSKPKKDADDIEDEFLDDDIEMDPELAEFADDVKELEEADAESEKIHANAASREADGEEEDEEAAAPTKKTPKEKSASERRIKKERDLLSGIDRNGDLSEIWQKFFDTHKSEKAKPYSMRETFEAKSALQHVKLGWGFILSNINDRLEVLFKEGIKVLISNYKS
jgi:hypothetical protein